ncbi:hypothetical protein NS115_03795 [Paenibacillus jamilae]|uniref:Uncharacterized protein n=1 Tax=Paenibacillus jamilae TaxID=114136 RepID=A0ACC4ZZR0_9BACL|nr:hypothetical protein [Paenibacillus jamilae]KTS84462.1 hypothetical protein NS115_03795 [Paenibacillus jamilae]
MSELNPQEIFIKNVLNVDVDGLKHKNRYVVRAMYNVRQEDESGVWYKIVQRVIEDLTLTWDEIEEEGGVCEINKQLKECYNV